MSFTIDSRITSSSFFIKDWPLCSLFLKNNADYPWFILVPRRSEVQALDQLNTDDQQQLMIEINKLSTIIRKKFNPDTINVGALGNIVAQLHIHVIARFQTDKLWPHGVWQQALTSQPYDADILDNLLQDLLRD